MPTAPLGSALDQPQVGAKLVSSAKITEGIRPKVTPASGSSSQSTVRNVSQVPDAGANKSDAIAGITNVSEASPPSSTLPGPQESDNMSQKGSSKINTGEWLLPLSLELLVSR